MWKSESEAFYFVQFNQPLTYSHSKKKVHPLSILRFHVSGHENNLILNSPQRLLVWSIQVSVGTMLKRKSANSDLTEAIVAGHQ